VENKALPALAEAVMKERKVLIVAPNWIGDAVLSLPVLEAGSSLWGEAELTVLARRGVSEIFRAARPEVKVIEYQRGFGLSRIRQFLQLGRSIGREVFALALILPNSLSAALLVWIAGVPERVGYATDGRGWLLTEKVRSRRKERGLHQVDYYVELIRSLGATGVNRLPTLQLKPEFAKRASALLAEAGVGDQEILVGVHPGAAYGVTKRWFPERFAAVLDRLHKPGRRILLFGGASETPLAEEISTRMRQAPVNFVGRTSVTEVTALINRCSLFLSNDSGLMHVAAALSVPQVALFGSTDPQKTAPLNAKAVVIHPTQVDCTPCFKRRCPHDLECLKAITVDEVCAAAERLLGY
jgi:heptosyltransferase-2